MCAVQCRPGVSRRRQSSDEILRARFWNASTMSVAEGAASGRGRADSKQLNDRRHRQFRISGKLASTPPLSLSLSHRRVGLPSPILPRLARYAWIILPRFMLILGPAGRPTEFERVPSSKKGEVSLSKMLHKMLHGSEGIRRIGPTALVEVRTSNPPSMRTRCRLLECRLLWFLRYNILSSWRFSSA